MKNISILGKILLFVFFIFPHFVFAKNIDESLVCTIQEFENISIATNSTDSLSFETHTPKRQLIVMYKPTKSNGVILRHRFLKN